MATIAVLGTLDSKGFEHEYVANIIRKRGHKVKLIDLGTGGPAQIEPDFSRFDVAESAGLNLQELMDRQDRGECVVAMSKAAPIFLAQLVDDKVIDGVISLGGGGGTALATSAMRALPIGFPKLMVSTLASGNTEHYLGTKDIAMMPSIVDVAGLNSISKMIFARAAVQSAGWLKRKLKVMKTVNHSLWLQCLVTLLSVLILLQKFWKVPVTKFWYFTLLVQVAVQWKTSLRDRHGSRCTRPNNY